MLGVTKMAAAVGVELAEPAIIAPHRLQGGEGRGGAFLGKEARVQNAAVGVIQCHDQVLHRQASDPFMGRGVQVNQHADYRSALAPAPVLAARGFSLHYPGLLEH